MKLRKVLKRTFIALFVIIVLCISALIAIPYFFKDELLQTIKDTVNASINGKFDFEDANLSLLRSFPNASVRVDNYSLEGLGAFEGIPLIKGRAVDVTVDIWSLLKSDQPMLIRGIDLNQPMVNIQILKDGTANYDIALPDTSTVETEQAPVEYELNLKKYVIDEGSFFYRDRSTDTEVEIRGLNHTGSAAIKTNLYNLFTNTQIDTISLAYGNISYLKNAKVDMQADV
ncbi:MAG: hypothetical protein KDC44_21390, partial [Phaeodactylibacter sp.]|nr:hypothetical protein [Phaeodactylibacter sp.]